MKLAFFTPLNPQRSGIADYSEALLPHLARQAEIDLFVEEGVTPTTPAIADHFAVFPYTAFEQRQRKQPYDLCLYQMGNNTAFHRYMDAFIQTYPGVVTLHDYVLHHFYAEMFADEARYDEYQTAMQAYYGEFGRYIAEGLRRGIRSNYVYYQLPFYQRVVTPSRGTIVHSSYLKTKILQYDPSQHVEVINMGITRPDLARYDLDQLRAKHQLAPDAFVIASFGFIIQDKRIRELLRTFARFAQDVPEARCVLVGKESPAFDVRRLLRELALEEQVIITGYTPYQDFLEYMALADVCVNLRYPTVRATSANILKIMAFAKPVIVSNLCELLDLPETVCVKVPVNDAEEPGLLNAFQRLYADPAARRELGQRARQYVATYHTLPQAAAHYLRFCQELSNGYEVG